MVEPSGGGRLVGRGEFLRSLGSAVDQAAGGTPTAVVVSGEVGVGKTRLVRELLDRDDVVVFAGACLPVVGEPLPYAALTQALRSSGAGVVRRELARSPELARLLPATGRDDEPAPTGEGSRLHLFQSVLGLLGRLGGPRPVVHVVEDLHWADRSTLDLLSFLAANLDRERVLLVLTYRSDAVGPVDPLVGWLAELGRMMPLERIALDRLEPDETAQLLADLLADGVDEGTHGPPDPILVETVVQRSDGNPLFVEQLALTGGDQALPATIQDLLLARVGGLPDDTRTLLGAASVIGRVASLPLLARTVGQDQAWVEAALGPALAAHVAELTPDGRLDVHHPAFREVVYAGLMPGERIRLHLAAAEALSAELDRSPAVVGEMARHWHAAGDLPRALDASVAAGRTYDRMFAAGDAYSAYARALDLAERVPHGLDLVDLRVRAADAAGMTGDTDVAVRLLEEAREHSHGVARARVCERLGTIHRQAGNGELAEARLREASALLPADEMSVLAARVEAGIALLAVGWSRVEEAERAGARALEIARTVGARSEEGRALNACGAAAAIRGEHDRGIELLREALRLAREEEHPYDLGVAYINLSHVLGIAGRLDESVELGRAGIVELSRVGQGRQQGSLLLANVAEVLTEAGRYDEAAELVADALSRHPRGIIAAPVLREAARIATVRGELTAAWERCEQARLAVESASAPVSWQRVVAETAAEVELWAGRPDAAYDLVVDALDQVVGTDDEAFAGTLSVLGLRALADDAAVRRDHRSRAQREPRRLRLRTVRARVDDLEVDAGLPEHGALSAWAAAELARLDHDDAAASAWAASVSAWEELGRPFRTAYALWRQAEAALAQGVSADSLHVLRTAHASARALGATSLTEELETLAGWYRADLLPPPDHDAAEETPLAAYGLTSRELEVLTAVAAGHTNREIAEELFISVKTASVHVSNILRKLDVKGRQDAARIAHRLGA